jgi:multidrug efflux pump subunit AcrB
VVAVAVPVSLLAALALLFVGDLSLNLITLFGLAVGIGMLVDNSIVVYEAVQRQLERGARPDEAAAEGIRRTVRAIVAATATTAVVFLPIAYAAESTMVRGLLNMLATAILLPLASSLLVAVGLVPLLARRLAAPAAISRLQAKKQRRESFAGLVLPDRGRELFSGFLKVALRRPALWLLVVFAAVFFTVILALPLVAVMMGAEEPREADEVRLTVDVPRGESLDAIKEGFASLEKAALNLDGVEYVESVIQEDSGSLTVKFEVKDKRPEDLTALRVRKVLRDAAEPLVGFDIRTTASSGSGGSERGGGTGNLFGTGPAEIVVSGPDVRKLADLAEAVRSRLESVPEVGRHGVWISGRGGQAEIRVTPDDFMLTQLGLNPDQVLPALSLIRREGTAMRTGFILADGREIPLTVRINEDQPRLVRSKIEDLRLATPIGVMPLGALAEAHKMPPPPTIFHHNGRREVSVYYRFNDRAPGPGRARRALEEQVLSMVREVHRPAGYTVETQGEDESTSWFKRVLVPIILLLFAVLAVTFESLTLPVLVLLSVPLTILGATWALVLSGMSA